MFKLLGWIAVLLLLITGFATVTSALFDVALHSITQNETVAVALAIVTGLVILVVAIDRLFTEED